MTSYFMKIKNPNTKYQRIFSRFNLLWRLPITPHSGAIILFDAQKQETKLFLQLIYTQKAFQCRTSHRIWTVCRSCSTSLLTLQILGAVRKKILKLKNGETATLCNITHSWKETQSSSYFALVFIWVETFIITIVTRFFWISDDITLITRKFIFTS